MSWSEHQLVCVSILIIILLQSNKGHSKCVSTSDTRLCGNSCSRSCPGPSSCQEQCTYCKTGYYGPRCVRRCKGNSHCLNDNCVLLPSGRALNCSEGCKTGWRGLSCNTRCKHPCLACDRYSGNCVGACRDGYFGSGCSERCNEHCVKCDRSSGECVGPCWDGYFGPGCSLGCDENCVKCHMETGNCTGPCVAGFYGENCSEHCVGDCETCDRISGGCVNRLSATDNEDFVTANKIGSQGRFDAYSMAVIGTFTGVTLLIILIGCLYHCTRKYRSQKTFWNKERKEILCYEAVTVPCADQSSAGIMCTINDNPRTRHSDTFTISLKSKCTNVVGISCAGHSAELQISSVSA